MNRHTNIEENTIQQLRERANTDSIPEPLSPEVMQRQLQNVNPKIKKIHPRRKLILAAASLIVLFGVGLVWNQTKIQAPTTSGRKFTSNATNKDGTIKLVSAGSLSPASDVEQIQKAVKSARISEAFTDIIDNIFSGSKGDRVNDELPKSDMATAEESASYDGASSRETNNGTTVYSKTNTQEAGVDEADLVKTDGTYLYMLRNNDHSEQKQYDSIYIYKPENGKLNEIARLPISSEPIQVNDFYLCNNRLVILEQVDDASGYGDTLIHIVDVSNPAAPKEISRNKQEGISKTSRLVNGYLYTVSAIYKEFNDFSDSKKSVPKLNSKSMSANDIYLPYDISQTEYLIVTSLSIDNPKEFKDQKAFLTGSSDFYVSNKNLYVSSSVYTSTKTKGHVYNTVQTEIIKLPYENGQFKKACHGIVPGTTNNNFSYNEKDGHLRVVTTVTSSTVSYDGRRRIFSFEENDEIAYTPPSTFNNGNQFNALYILDENMKRTGQVEGLAPGESVYSARFLGNYGYFVTYRQTDPLFSVDLSDPKNPKVLDALKIPGFSSYLHFFNENQLLGFGDETDPNTQQRIGLKLSLFDTSNPSDIREMDKCVLTDMGSFAYSEATDEYKAFLYEPERKLFGFPVYKQDPVSSAWPELHYMLYTYDDSGFRLLADLPLHFQTNTHYYSGIRGVTIGDYIYITDNTGGICSFSLTDYTKVDQSLFY